MLKTLIIDSMAVEYYPIWRLKKKLFKDIDPTDVYEFKVTLPITLRIKDPIHRLCIMGITNHIRGGLDA